MKGVLIDYLKNISQIRLFIHHISLAYALDTNKGSLYLQPLFGHPKLSILGRFKLFPTQFIAQELISTQDTLYYWSRQKKNSSAEVDFLAVKEGEIIPVEVKSGSSGRLKSLHLFLQSFPNCKEGYVFSCRPYSQLSEQKLKFIPLYFCQSAFSG